MTGPFDEELVAKLPSSLKYICHNGAGYDNIDVAACSSKSQQTLPCKPSCEGEPSADTRSLPDIQVSSTPVAVNNATADVAIFLMLGALRRVHIPYSAVRSGKWRGPSFQLGYDPQNKILGILGMGGIGREVAARARAFGMSVQYYNRSRLSPELERGAKHVPFEELMRTSDVLSLNCSLRKETIGIIGRKEFAMMKEGVILVNTARGKLIDEQALVDALDEGKVFSAGLDVYQEEPKVHEGLLDNPNVVLLPHIGTSTKETQVGYLIQKAGQLADFVAAKYGVVGIGEHEECGGERHLGDSSAGAGQPSAAWQRSTLGMLSLPSYQVDDIQVPIQSSFVRSPA